MVSVTKQVFKKALSLPPIERAELIEYLLQSFDFKGRKQIDKLWEEEVEKRIGAHDKGLINTIPAQKVFEKIGRKK